MASDYYDMMMPGMEQFLYLKCPSKIRAAFINAGGPRVSVDEVCQRLNNAPMRRIRYDVGEPTENDGEVFAPRGLNVAAIVPVKPVKPRLVVSDEERARIAAIAATIPDKVVRKPKCVQAKLQPVSPDFAQDLISRVLRCAGIYRKTFFVKRRRGKAKGAAAMITVILREVDSKRYSFPVIAKYLRKQDHTTIIHAVDMWPEYAECWPDLADIYQNVMAELREGEE